MKQVHEVIVGFSPCGLSVDPDPVEMRIGESLRFTMPSSEEISVEFEERRGYRGPFRERAHGENRGEFVAKDGVSVITTGPIDQVPVPHDCHDGELWKYTIILRRGPLEVRLDPGVMVRNGD